MTTTKLEEIPVRVGPTRFTWLPLIPWALALACGIAAMGIGSVTGH